MQIAILDDKQVEGEETLAVVIVSDLQTEQPVTTSGSSVATITLVDNDGEFCIITVDRIYIKMRNENR